MAAALSALLASCSSSDSGGSVPTTVERAKTTATTTVTAGDGGDDEADRHVQLLFAVTADGGSVEAAAGESTLTLKGTDLSTVAFGDRPSRFASTVPTSALVASWDDLFADDPPNAVLVEHDPSGNGSSTVVTLADPTYDERAATLSFTVRTLLEEDQPDAVASIGGTRRSDTPGEFGAATLFIDSGDVRGLPSPLNNKFPNLPSYFDTPAVPPGNGDDFGPPTS